MTLGAGELVHTPARALALGHGGPDRPPRHCRRHRRVRQRRGVAVNGGRAASATATEFGDDDLVQVSVLARWLPSRLVFEFVNWSTRHCSFVPDNNQC